MTQQKKEAIEIFGKEKVDEVLAIVYISDPDCAYTTLLDQEDEDGAAIVEMIFFDSEGEPAY